MKKVLLKTLYFLIFCLLINGVAFSRTSPNPIVTKSFTDNDSALVLQKCLDMPELQQYYTKSSDGTFSQVHVMQYPIVFSPDIAVTKFQLPILLEPREVIYASKADGFFIFKSFQITGNTATVVFDYNYNYTTAPAALQVTLSLQKTGTDWSITNTLTHNR